MRAAIAVLYTGVLGTTFIELRINASNVLLGGGLQNRCLEFGSLATILVVMEISQHCHADASKPAGLKTRPIADSRALCSRSLQSSPSQGVPIHYAMRTKHRHSNLKTLYCFLHFPNVGAQNSRSADTSHVHSSSAAFLGSQSAGVGAHTTRLLPPKPPYWEKDNGTNQQRNSEKYHSSSNEPEEMSFWRNGFWKIASTMTRQKI
jgi:hypothetical protein